MTWKGRDYNLSKWHLADNINARTHRKVLDFISRNAPESFDLLSVSSSPNCQGYLIERIGPEGKSGRREVNLSGIQLIAEDWVDPQNQPF